MSWVYLGTFIMPRCDNLYYSSKYNLEVYRGIGEDEGYFQYYFANTAGDYAYYIAKSLCPFKIICDDGKELFPTYENSNYGTMIWSNNSGYLYDGCYIEGTKISYRPYTYRYKDSERKLCIWWNTTLERKIRKG